MSTEHVSDHHLGTGSQLGRKLLLLSIIPAICFIAMLAMLWSNVPNASGWFFAWAVILMLLGMAGVALILKTALGGFLTPLGQLSTGVRASANGDLVTDLKFDSSTDIGQIGNQFDRLIGNLSITVANIRNSTSVVAQTGNNLTQASSALSERTSQQAATLEETAASILEITETVSHNSRNAQEANRQASKVRDTAKSGEQIMRAAVETMHAIQVGSKRMSEIVSVIDGIAFQTNILALNASVEAARAGEQGRSFAVVASEVSTLAHRSAQAAREIGSLISTSSDQVAEGVTRVDAVAQSLQTILSGAQHVATQINEISNATAEQSKELSQISIAIGELDSITQQNSQLVEQSANAAAELTERAARIGKSVERFRLRQGSAEEAMDLVHRVLEQAQLQGVQAAIDAVNDPKMGFHDRDMYVFIADSTSKFMAWATKPERVGTRATDTAGVDAKRVLMRFIATAQDGGGWVEYDLANPATGKIEPKMTYVMPLNDMFVGCGVYRTEQMSFDH